MAGLKLAPVDESAPAIEIQGDRATLGRTAGVDHVVNDPSVSRQHAVFERQAGVWTVSDQGSANGTFLDGQRIASAVIRDGQEVRFGAKAFRVHIDWADVPTAFIPPSALPPPAAPLPIPPRPIASAPPLPPTPPPPMAALPSVAHPPIPPRPIPPRPVAPPAMAAPPSVARPPIPRHPPVAEPALPPTIPPQRGPLYAPPRPPMAPPRPAAGFRASQAEATGLWREGKALVFAKVTHLPDACVKCGQPAAIRLRRKLSWHNPWLGLLIPLGLLIYVIVASVVSKRAEVEIPLCEAHRKRRTLLTGLGIALLFLGLFAFAGLLLARAGAILAALAALVFLVGMVLAIVGQILVSPGRIDDHFVWLRGVHESLLSGQPSWPGPTAALMGLGSSGGLRASAPAAASPPGMAQAAFVSGWLSILLCPAPVAVVLGILGIVEVRREPGGTGMGRSVFSLVAGLVGSVVLGLVLLNGFLNGFLSEPPTASATPRPRLSPPAFPAPTAPAVATVVIRSKDGALEIAAPSGWRSESELNPNAELQACDAPQQVCVLVFEEDKLTTGDITLARFSRFARGQILKKLGSSSEGTGIALRVAGHPAVQYELRGRAERFDLVYLHTSVETPGHFYQVLGWTSSNLYPQEKAVISGVTDSFRPGAGR